MSYAIVNGSIYTETGRIPKGYLIIENDMIKEIKEGPYTGDLETIDAEGQHILPGFIDIHIHGGYGEDAMDASYTGLQHLASQLLSEGTTSFLATTMTQSTQAIERALKNIVKVQHDQKGTEAADIIGVHLEGPFISEHKIGAQNPKFIQRPTPDQLQHLQNVAQGQIKIVTIAPEVEGAEETIKAMKNDVIFSMGHSEVTFDQANHASEIGVKHVTHLYNAGTPFVHRDPGMFGAAWLNPNINCEIIGDGVHSHPASVKIAYKQKGADHLYLITDAMRAKGMPDGCYDLGGQDVIVKDNEAHLKTGSLAGSILKMNEGLRNLIAFTEGSLETLWRCTSFNQAQVLGIDDQKGSIKEGKLADLVILDEHMDVKQTIKSGCVHQF
ncbi:N-acetylglucosamine-6-phosphate deacetylase [Staphylococcus chromogenes]|uniref:N-acetylglucosamine-6-phosphate deacetylase n=1 Tax=Staphylococcus chromogenes TaxID=46126 RepID=UPI002887744F|nr:N-acetylglucosamine-6-phosphate deacetylase [Staphylococcus chromogenes]MDT0736506.1 N-acetylglucosamine-6-phosphate deacetylase [Staphylococcus chromogenes]MDT0749520.1 N-acetylglucosamine-6-phosphate deacetylase [Staphylococcus chromogenes]MDU0481445.1 N-acetylglucosamine-6-phosphate deacetylase [Staphylococcus chromogenes]